MENVSVAQSSIHPLMDHYGGYPLHQQMEFSVHPHQDRDLHLSFKFSRDLPRWRYNEIQAAASETLLEPCRCNSLVLMTIKKGHHHVLNICRLLVIIATAA